MKKIIFLLCTGLILGLLSGCTGKNSAADVVATTKPVYDFTQSLCSGTGLTVEQLVTESVSCLHDYTLQVRQMRAIEGAQTVVISGAGLESFLHDVLHDKSQIIDASENIPLLCGSHKDEHDEHDAHDAHEHHHSQDPHIWLSIKNARKMAENICRQLCSYYPEHQSTFEKNLSALQQQFDELQVYADTALSQLSTRNMVTFHDGFSYFAQDLDLTILHALEEESGSEASAAELKELIVLVEENRLPAIFTEENGSTSAASVIASETGISVFALSMGMSEKDYFTVMYDNIDSVKEALG